MGDDAPGWRDILDEPFVTLILGRRGSGKTALGHRLLEEFSGARPDLEGPREAYIMGFPRQEMDLLPEWIHHLPIFTPLEDWPERAIVLITEAHHIMHARRSQSDENLEVDRLVTLSRQRDLDIVLDTQYARRLDVTGVMGATAMVWRYPSLVQEDFERRQLRKFVREAKEALDQYVELKQTDEYTLLHDDDALYKHAYIFSERFRGVYPREIELPFYWSEDISKAIGSKDDTDPEVNSVPTINGAMADLEDVEEKSTSEIDDLLGDHGLSPEIDEGAVEEGETPTEVDAEALKKGKEFIEQMISSGNRVFQNAFPTATIEIVVPKDFKQQAEKIIDEWLLNPQGHLAVAQEPSFADDRPEIAEGLVGFQFFLDEGMVEDLSGSPYAIENILDELPDDKWIATKARAVRASLV